MTSLEAGEAREGGVGASGRALRRPLASEVEALGPPPTPVLAPPWGLAAVEPAGAGLDLVHRWMSEPHVAEFWGQNWPRRDWAEEVRRQLAGDHSRPWTVSYEGAPVAYVEVYRASRDVLADHYPAAPHDLGVHIAIGDHRRTGRGLGPRVLRAVSDALFRADARCEAVVGDPDAAHGVARRAFAAAGFVPVAEVDLPHKRAAIVARRRLHERDWDQADHSSA
jgi:RimJ/RimL family protein N-acetyltransferase